jgi:hypothetical protein
MISVVIAAVAGAVVLANRVSAGAAASAVGRLRRRAGDRASSSEIVHAGAFCAEEGATGVTDQGEAMVCRASDDGRHRWQHA